MHRLKYYFFPSLCSHVEREVIYVDIEIVKEKKEKRLEENDHEKIAEERVINFEECSGSL